MGCGCYSTPREPKPIAFWKDQPIFEEGGESRSKDSNGSNDGGSYGVDRDFLDLLFYIFNIDNGYKIRNLMLELKYLNWVAEKNNYHLIPKADLFGRYNLETVLDFMVRYDFHYLFFTRIDIWIKFYQMVEKEGAKVLIFMKRERQASHTGYGDTYVYTLSVSYDEIEDRAAHLYKFSDLRANSSRIAVWELINNCEKKLEKDKHNRKMMEMRAKISEARAKLEDG
jgi:hypothetical protein